MRKIKMKIKTIILIPVLFLFLTFSVLNVSAGVTMGTENLGRHVEKVQPLQEFDYIDTIQDDAITIEDYQNPSETPKTEQTHVLTPVPEPSSSPEPVPVQKKTGKPVFLIILTGLAGFAGIRKLLKTLRRKMDERTERDF
jgi:hypothetical protein